MSFFIDIDINECDRSDSCGKGAVCTNTGGSYSCDCPRGTAPNPDPHTHCISVVTCQKESDCPGNAICDRQNRCFCPEPNVGNDCRRKLFSFFFNSKITSTINYGY